MRVLVASLADEASRSQRDALLELAPWSEDARFEGLPTWRRGDLWLVTIPEHHLYRDRLDEAIAAQFGGPPELLVYLSKHRSESGTPSLTVHPIGNVGPADFGGVARTLVPAAARAMTGALRALRREAAGLAYNVTFEATHHGPHLATPTFYIEQGSTEREWGDLEAARAIARTLLGLEPVDAPIAIGIGGGHYAPRHTDVALGRRVAFGHLLPTHALRSLDDALLAQAVHASRATLAYVHRKAVPGTEARRLEDRLGALGVKVVREADLAAHPVTKDS
ncbi:MAG: D-aminoacyl-tRNA deacylase [Methanobacteriota archaeon]